MDIISRLKIFLEKRRISNSVFADNCKIARPTLSQLLTGRNKKVSDEVVSKIHEAYPELSIMWLLFGEGAMEVENAEVSNSAGSSEEPSIFDEKNISVSSQSKVIDFDDEKNEAGDYLSESSLGSSLQDAMRIIANTSEQQQSVPVAGVSAGAGKKIVNIMVFYSDKSFDSFVPAGKQRAFKQKARVLFLFAKFEPAIFFLVDDAFEFVVAFCQPV